MKQPIPAFVCLVGFALLGLRAGHGDQSAKRDQPAKPVDYAKQIKPIFAKHCYQCHGAKKRQSGYRLDAARFAIRGGDRGAAIVPGNSAESLLYQAIVGQGDVEAMPAEGPQLNKSQIAIIKRWIEEGAKAPRDEAVAAVDVKSGHWAFQPVKRSKLPTVGDTGWVRNPIDAFILSRLETEGLKPSREADSLTLIRRLSLDLRGLPPTLEEIEEYLSDERPGAYVRLVDRMLSSPFYGERWGRHWLDVARYADSDGFTIDAPRPIWKYRDWVIDAWNRDLPFDQFTIEQLAGDLLPNGSIDQQVATGFHRNTLINGEGGTDNEQFRVDAVVDRVNTTGSVFLGLTIGCARCHDHKYDPISQREFYELFAIFNSCEDVNTPGPTISLPSPTQAVQLKALRAEIAAVEQPLKTHDAEFLKGLPEWEKTLSTQAMAISWTLLDPIELRTDKGSQLAEDKDKSIFVDFSAPPNDTFTVVVDVPLKHITGVRLEALTHPNLPKNGPGRSRKGNFVLSEFEFDAAPLQAEGTPGQATPVRIAKAVADHSQIGYPIRHAVDGNQKSGWSIDVQEGRLNVQREAIFILTDGIRNEGGSRLTFRLHQNHSEAGFLLGRFRLSASAASPELLETPVNLRKILAIAAQNRTKAQTVQLTSFYRQTDTVRFPMADRLGRLKKAEEELVQAIPTTMVMRELKKPRETHIHVRGDFLRKGARVSRGVPAVLPKLPSGVKNPTRLDFARWLVDPQNPLTARVTMNRFWQRFFGIGLVDTENDFGTQGSPPTHAELLDWLAGEFIRQKWSTKSVLRLIVTSATYRQSSEMRDELFERDPANRLLARQSRLRLEAETIRDVCLAASGLLSKKMKGPSVYPPQPKGISVLTQIKKGWPESQGADRSRRGMYTYFWRSNPYPFLPTFDAPGATTTCTRRARSNTPLQALTLANDRSFFEIAKGLARRILRQAPEYQAGRIRFGFRLCLARGPSEPELVRLNQFFEKQQKFFQTAEQQAHAAAPSDCPQDVSVADAAAWTAVARVLLNLDELITRE
jgi:mono/diheme cytochrome c family protein